MKKIINHIIAFFVIALVVSLIVFYFTPTLLKTTLFSIVVPVCLVIGCLVSGSLLYFKWTMTREKVEKKPKISKGIGIKGLRKK